MPRAVYRPCQILFIAAVLALSLPSIAAAEYEPIQPHLGAGQGTWPDQMVFDLVPAPRGVVPELSVVHDHRVVDGVLGQGFTLNGLSVITRHSATGGIPGVTAGDLYRLNGQRLLKVPGTNRWEPEVQTGTTLSQSFGNTWTMKKEGWTWIYGSRARTGTGATKYIRDSAGQSGTSTTFPGGHCNNLQGLCNTAAWYLSLVTDPYGNTIRYDYTVMARPMPSSTLPPYPYPQQHLLARIVYAAANAIVEFDYKERPAIHTLSDYGTPSLLTHRLEEVKVFGRQRTFYSRYSFEYQDESSTDCGGRPAAAATGLEQPRKVLLRRIHRHDNSGTERVMRCYDTARESPSWSAAQDVTTSITAPNVSGSVAGTFVAPIPMNADGDGLTDLALLGFNCGPVDLVTGHLMEPEYELDGGIPAGDLGVKPYRCEADHQVFVSTPGGPKPFAGAGTGHPSQAHLAAWEGLLNRALNGTTLRYNQGYALVDLDRDAWPELLWEDSGVKISSYRPGHQDFVDSNLSISPAQLRKGSFVDVNGDGFPDLALREAGTWIPNRGVAPWLVPGDALPLNMPVTASNVPADLTALISDPAICDNYTQSGSHPNFYGTDPVPDPNTWSTGRYRTGQTRLTDINGDGLVDATIAFYACWDDGDPVPESAYSRIFWGDGYGSFVDSKLSAGPPFMFPRNTIGRHLDGFTMLDVDGDQRAEMLQLSAHGLSTSNYSAIGGGYDHGLVDGFVLPDPGHPYGTPQGFAVPLDSLSRVNHATALADFDGDSFPDLLVLEMEGDEDDDYNPNGGWTAELRRNQRNSVEGRVIATRGEHGGRTELTWGWSALGPHDNPDLPENLEVLEEVDGADGVVRAVYSRGHHAPHRGFTGFGLVQVTNPRGGVVEHAYATTPALQGKPTHGVRYRHDGTIERASVHVHGHPGATIGPLYVDLSPPFFNPLLRQCDFDLDFGRRTAGAPRQTFNIETLVEDCTEYGVPKDEGPPLAELMVVVGHHRYPDHESLAPLANAMWSPPGGDDQPIELGQMPALAPGVKVSPGQGTAQPPAAASDPFRWPAPAGVAVPQALELGQGELAFPAGTVPTRRRFYVTDWQYMKRDDGRYVLDKELRHRDVSTPGDDQRTLYSWSHFDTNYWGRRLEQRRQTNAAGQPYERYRVTNWSPDFALPAAVESCGTSINRCRTDRYTWTGRGELDTHTYPDQSTDSWTYAWCGAAEKYTDPVNRDRVTAYDNRCLPRTETWQGAVTTTTFDGFNRLIRHHEQPGGTAEAQLVETFFDDQLDHVVDSSFQEPRVATRRGDGRVTLTYHDEFGRTMREEICRQSTDSRHAGDGVLAKVWCRPGTKLIAGWGLFGSDGLVRATIDPHFPNEVPVMRGVTRDGYGRVVAEQMPAHVERRRGAEEWLLTTTVHGPDYRRRIDPLGRETRVDSTTLGFEVSVAGKFRGRTELDAFSRIVRRVASDGLTTIIGYDELHHLASLQLDATAECLRPNGSLNPACIWRRSWTRDLQGRIESVTRADGETYTYTLDAAGRPESIQHRGKLLQSWKYLPGSATALARTEETDEAGNLTVRHADGLGQVQQVDDLSGTTTLKWGADGQLKERVDPNERATTYRHDIYGHLVETVRPESGRTRVRYDGAGRKLSVTDADGAVVDSTYLFSGLLEKETRGPWTTLRASYDDAGRPIDLTHDGVTTHYTHDAWNRVTRRDDGWNPRTRTGLSYEAYTYDDSDRMLTETLGPIAGGTLDRTFAYNPLGWLESVTDGAGREVGLLYDRAGRLRARDDEEGYRRLFEYDSRGFTSREDSNGRGALRHNYQAPASFLGQSALHRFTTTDADGHVLTLYLDGLRRPTAQVFPDGTYNTYTYTGRDLTESDLRDADGGVLLTLSYQHEPGSGRILATEGPATPAEAAAGDVYRLAFTYTSAGRPRTLTADDDHTRFTYDPQGLPVSEASNHIGSRPGQRLTKYFVRDPAREAPWVTGTRLVGGGGAERKWTFERDALGRLTAATVDDGNGKLRREWSHLNVLDQPRRTRVLVNNREEVRREWQYDSRGLPTSRSTFLLGQLDGATLWDWYDNGVLKSIRTPNGHWMHYDYGTPFDHQLDRVHNGRGHDFAHFKRRNGRGQPELIDLSAGNTTLELTYDSFGRLEDRLSTSPQNGRSQLHLSYDDAGRLRSEELTDGPLNWLNRYTYDGLGRLVNEERGATGVAYRYVLDGAGNRLETWRDAGAGEQREMLATYQGPRLATVNGTRLTYDPWHAVTVDQRGYRYGRGPDGRVRTVNSGQGQSTTVLRDSYGVPAAYEEGSQGRRLVTWNLDPDTPPLEVKEAGGSVITYVRAEGLMLARLTDGTLPPKAALHDTAGSLTRLGASPLRHATAFGQGVQSPPGIDERYLFAGLEHLPAAPGIHLAHHRIYDPETGRFLSPDPIGLQGGVHRYLYADGNPVMKRDPQGLAAIAPQAGGSTLGTYEIPQDNGGEYEDLQKALDSILSGGQGDSPFPSPTTGCQVDCPRPLGGVSAGAPFGSLQGELHSEARSDRKAAKEQRQANREQRRAEREKRRDDRWGKKIRPTEPLIGPEDDPENFDKCGFSCRLFGGKHKQEHWTRVWNAQKDYEAEAAKPGEELDADFDEALKRSMGERKKYTENHRRKPRMKKQEEAPETEEAEPDVSELPRWQERGDDDARPAEPPSAEPAEIPVQPEPTKQVDQDISKKPVKRTQKTQRRDPPKPVKIPLTPVPPLNRDDLPLEDLDELYEIEAQIERQAYLAERYLVIAADAGSRDLSEHKPKYTRAQKAMKFYTQGVSRVESIKVPGMTAQATAQKLRVIREFEEIAMQAVRDLQALEQLLEETEQEMIERETKRREEERKEARRPVRYESSQ